MDVLKLFIQSLIIAAWLAICPAGLALASNTATADPYQRVYDYADIFTDSEEAELRGTAQAYSEQLDVHFVILAIDDYSVDNLEVYCDEFYLTNIAGVDDIYECAFMQINMATRRVANRYYGELRDMISDSEADVISNGYGSYMSDGEYKQAARYFLVEAARLIDVKLEEYHLETPQVDPRELIYDFGGVLSDDEYIQLYDAAKYISNETGVGHVAAILGEGANEWYLQRYAQSFYKKNFHGSGLFSGAFILVVSAGHGTAYASPYGAYIPTNDVLWETNRSVQSKLRVSVFAGCRYFLYQQTDVWHSKLLEMPYINPNENIHDFTGFLTKGQISGLRALIRENYEKHGVDVQIVCSDIDGPLTLDAFRRRLPKALEGYGWEFSGGNYVLLIIGSPPVIEGERQYVEMIFSGDIAKRKIGLNRYDILDETRNALDNNQDYYWACTAFVNGITKALGSLVPNVLMVEEIGWVLQISLPAALGLALLLLLILRIMHGFGMKRKISAYNYLVAGSVRLHYANDVFLHTHTSRTRIVRDTDSGGSSGGGFSGSSGGGISSGSERSF